MTVIAAVHQNGETWIGSDTFMNDNDTKRFVSRKWIVAYPWAIGVAGESLTQQVLSRKVDDWRKSDDPFEIAQAVKETLTSFGYKRDDDESTLCLGHQMIFASPHGVWSMAVNFAIHPMPKGELWADGSGRAFALGADFAARNLTAEQRVRTAIEAAIAYEAYCGGDVWLHRLTAL